MTEQNPGSTSRNMNKKRDDYLDWEDYFMATACLAAQRSKDPVTQVGACIVNQEKRIVGVGYNGMAFGCSDDEYSWGKEKNEDSKHLYVCHAEMNAILNKNAFDVKGCKLYVSLFPCNECTKLIIQSGIKHVVYLSEKSKITPETKAAKRMFESAEVTTRKYRPKRQKITIDFEQKTST